MSEDVKPKTDTDTTLGDSLADLASHEAEILRMMDGTANMARRVQNGTMAADVRDDNEDWALWQVQQAKERARRATESINAQLGVDTRPRKFGNRLLSFFSNLRRKV